AFGGIRVVEFTYVPIAEPVRPARPRRGWVAERLKAPVLKAAAARPAQSSPVPFRKDSLGFPGIRSEPSSRPVSAHPEQLGANLGANSAGLRHIARPRYTAPMSSRRGLRLRQIAGTNRSVWEVEDP